MKALVLAAGFGTRLKEVIHDRPKVMAPISGRPFLEYVINNLAKQGVTEFVLATGYLGDYIKEYFQDGGNLGLKISYSYQPYPIGTGGAVRLAESEGHFTKPYFIVNGDTYLETDLKKLMDFHESKKAQATIALLRRKHIGLSRQHLDITSRSNGGQAGLALLNNNKQITAFTEKPGENITGYVNCGLYVFTPGAINIQKQKNRFSLEKDFFPKIAKVNKLYGFTIKEEFIDIGLPENYYKAQKILSGKKQQIIKVKVPVRISFAGGGTDLPEYFKKYEGCDLTATINRFAYLNFKIWDLPFIKVFLSDYQKEEAYKLREFLAYDNSVFDLYKAAFNRLRPDKGFSLTVKTDFPAGSGLGSSSAIVIGLVKGLSVLAKNNLTSEEIVRKAIEIERDELRIPGGYKDQYAISYGGINLFMFSKKGVVKKPITLNKKIKQKLEENLLLFYIGQKKNEKDQQKVLTDNILRSEKTQKALNGQKEIALSMLRILKKGDLSTFSTLLEESFLLKKKTSPIICTQYVDGIIKLIKSKGVKGVKLLGSGGGGCLLIYMEKNQDKLIKSLQNKGLRHLPFEFTNSGPEVETYEN